MVVYTCKKCGEPNYLTPHAFWNIYDFGAKCEKCERINTVTLENGELKKQLKFLTESCKIRMGLVTPCYVTTTVPVIQGCRIHK